MAVAVTFANNDLVTGNTSNPITFTALPTGVAAADRITAIALTMDGRDGATAVTINGVAATRAVTISPGTGYLMCEIWYAANPTGTTGNVVVTTGSDTAIVTMAVGAYRITGADAAPSSTDSAGTTGSVASISISALTIPTNGGAVYCAANGTPGTAVAWTNATESEDFSATAYRHTSALRTTAGTVTTTMDGPTDNHVICGAAWGEPSAGGVFPHYYYYQQQAA